MIGRYRRLDQVGRRRTVVLAFALVTTIAKLRLAATTDGTDDVHRWLIFAATVRRLGPIDIYATHLPALYNHPPLIGWFLVAVNAVSSLGLSVRFLVRVPASVADIATALLIFEFVRRRRGLTEASLKEATTAGILLAVSPVLLVISGFHGNTDPVFVMFTLLSAYFVVNDRPLWAGVSVGVAISIKLVPVVALPVLALGLMRNRRHLIASMIGFLAVVVPLWGVVIARQWAGFKRNVLDYKGIHPKDGRWGIVDFARHAHRLGLVDFLVGPGRFLALGISALVPAWLVLRRRDAVVTGVSLSLAIFLLLTTNFGTQYLAWAAPAAILIDVWAGAVYNVTAGVLLVVTYTSWTHGFPWYHAFSKDLTPSQERLGWLTWLALMGAAVVGIRRLLLDQPERPETAHAGTAADTVGPADGEDGIIRSTTFSKLTAGLAAALLATTALISSATSPASAYPFAAVNFTGHGWGHGRGMGQYGAYGYALAGQPYSWILDHFYGGTTLGTVSSATLVNVHLSAFDGFDTITQMTNAHLIVTWGGGGLGSPQSGVRVTHNPDGSLSVFTGPGCAGPWTPAGPPKISASDVTIAPQVPGDDIKEMVQACTPDASYHWYRGSIVTKTSSTQTWNSLALDQYVRGVVPRESPASWGTSGGEEALKAQAVAARSYGLAYVQAAGAVCDTTSCQVYGGRAVANSGGYQDLEGAGIYVATTDAAVAATALQVRLCAGSTGCPAGTVAHTEFSSSTGGYSAGGTFPPVVDDGDATPSNPNHTWTASVPVGTVQAAFGSIGVLQGVVVTQRNGHGDFGGRVLQIRLTGSAGSVAVSGDELASALGLKSNWFAVTNGVTGPSGGDNGYWLLGRDGGIFTFGSAGFYGSMGGRPLAQPVRGMAPTADQLGYWQVASDGGVFSFGDAGFFGSMGGHPLSQPVVGMAATHPGHGYWLVASDGGIFSFGDAGFLGSMGGRPLRQPVVGMAATPTGHGYWMVASDGGIFAFGDAGFYGSMGGVRLDQPIVGMVPTGDGRGYLLVGRDGGIFAFGDAHFEGSLPGIGIRDTVTAAQPTADALGYLMVAAGGAVYSFGDAPWYGGMLDVVPGYQGTIIDLRMHLGS